MAVIPGTAGSDQLDGTAGDDLIRGLGDQDTLNGLGGNDILRGGGGNDFLDGGDGDDRLIGGAGSDFGVFTLSPNGVTIDLVRGFARGWGNDLIRGVENIDGSLKNDVIRADDGDNFVNGNDGADRLFGLGGNDRLFGAAGDDRLVGGVGDDELTGDLGDDFLRGGLGTNKLDGGDGTDTASYAGLSVAVEILLAGGSARGVGVDDQLTDIENATGSKVGDRIFGNAAGNVLNGGAGDDALVGDAGDDVLIGGAGQDVMAGNSGADTYRFDRTEDSTAEAPDTIEDFFPTEEGDRIDLSRIDADVTTDGLQAFVRHVGAFTAPAQGRVENIPGGGSLIEFNTDGDPFPEMAILVGTTLTVDPFGVGA